MSLDSQPSLERQQPNKDNALGTIVKAVNHQLIDGIGYELILDQLFRALDTLVPFDRISIATAEPRNNELYMSSKWIKSKIPVKYLAKGYSAPLRGSSLAKVVETGTPRILNNLEDYLSDHPQSTSTRLALNDGIRSSLTCPLFADGKPLGVIFFSSTKPDTYKEIHVKSFLDISEEFSLVLAYSKIREKALQANSQSIRMVLHDLKSPLGVIQGFLDLAASEDWFDTINPEAKRIFSILNRNAKYSIDLLNEISELTQVDATAIHIAKEPVRVREFVSELAKQGLHLAEKKEIGFNTTMDLSVPETASFDPIKIRRVIDNLITNAIKYSHRHTNINFEVRADSSWLEFVVRDQGQGIPEHEMDRLFKEFGKTSTRPTEDEPSTGLGLAIAKRFVELHGGNITVKSTVGEGSTFTVRIPLK